MRPTLVMSPMFSEKLLKAIADRGINQSDLARAIGVDPGTVNKWVKLHTKPRHQTLVRVAQELKCSLDWLIADDDDPEPITTAAEMLLLDSYRELKRETGLTIPTAVRRMTRPWDESTAEEPIRTPQKSAEPPVRPEARILANDVLDGPMIKSKAEKSPEASRGSLNKADKK